MGFNRRKMEDQRRETAEKEAASRRATDAQVLEDAEHLIAAADDTDTTMSVAVTVTAEAACPYRKSKDLTSVDQRHERSPFQSGKAAAVVQVRRSPSERTVTTQNAANQPADNTIVTRASTVTVAVAGAVARAAVIDRS